MLELIFFWTITDRLNRIKVVWLYCLKIRWYHQLNRHRALVVNLIGMQNIKSYMGHMNICFGDRYDFAWQLSKIAWQIGYCQEKPFRWFRTVWPSNMMFTDVSMQNFSACYVDLRHLYIKPYRKLKILIWNLTTGTFENSLDIKRLKILK